MRLIKEGKSERKFPEFILHRNSVCSQRFTENVYWEYCMKSKKRESVWEVSLISYVQYSMYSWGPWEKWNQFVYSVQKNIQMKLHFFYLEKLSGMYRWSCNLDSIGYHSSIWVVFRTDSFHDPHGWRPKKRHHLDNWRLKIQKNWKDANFRQNSKTQACPNKITKQFPPRFPFQSYFDFMIHQLFCKLK